MLVVCRKAGSNCPNRKIAPEKDDDIFFSLNQISGVILDFGFRIADLLYRCALSIFISLTEYLISVGTGFSTETILFAKARRFNALNWAPYAIETFMDSANLQQNDLMKLMSQLRPDSDSSANSDFISEHYPSTRSQFLRYIIPWKIDDR